MCGIAGFVALSMGREQLSGIARGMASSLRRRGPDGGGEWFDAECGAALVHRRLSIFDLTELASQPMVSGCGRYVLVFNGEIYNFHSLRTELENLGFAFKSSGDTEVLLSALARWGMPGALDKLEGMFAFGLWDRDRRELTLARDRLGQKPLYYGFCRENFAFASELRALEVFDSSLEIDHESLALMLRYKSVPAPRSIYKGINKLLPGSYVVFSLDERSVSRPVKYWNALSSLPGALDGMGMDEALGQLEMLLDNATRKRMAADVPLGAFLSGGIDSSLIVATMARLANSPVRTYTIGFEERGYNEAEQAKEVAKILGTEHTELYLSESDILNEVPLLPAMCDEPFGDSSLLPTQLVSRLARTQVTVALSGDGGDEFFAGYNRHVWLPRMDRRFSRIPFGVRRWVSSLLSWPAFRALLGGLNAVGVLPVRMLDNKLDKLESLMGARGVEEMHRDALSDWKRPDLIVPGCILGAVDEFAGVPNTLSAIERLCRSDALFYLPEDILFKVDRASMFHSLEARSPFLDHKLIEFSLSVPNSLKIDARGGKLLLRRLLERYLPAKLVDRPKMGFAVPLGSWLRGPLREWADDLLRSDAYRVGEFLNRELVLNVWNEHQTGRRDHSGKLWNVLMFLSWCRSLPERRRAVYSEVAI